ncbi:MAG: class I SAM-dependent methyltransferase [Patescibacteria group bacterium]
MVKELWDKIFTEGKDFTHLNVVFLDQLLKKITKLRENRPAETLVDLGAGAGDAAVKFAQKGFRVQAVDWSEVALKQAEELAKRNEVSDKITFTQMSLEVITPAKIIFNPADIILCKLTLAFVENKDGFLASVKSLMSGSSIFVLITPVLYAGVTYTQEDKPHIAIDFNEVQDLLRKYFNRAEIFHHGYSGERQDVITFLAIK